MPASGTAAVLRTEPYWPRLRGEFWTQDSRRGTKASGGGGPTPCDGADPAFVSLTMVCSHLPNYRHLTVELSTFLGLNCTTPPRPKGRRAGDARYLHDLVERTLLLLLFFGLSRALGGLFPLHGRCGPAHRQRAWSQRTDAKKSHAYEPDHAPAEAL